MILNIPFFIFLPPIIIFVFVALIVVIFFIKAIKNTKNLRDFEGKIFQKINNVADNTFETINNVVENSLKTKEKFNKVKCDYCGTFVDNNSTKCPNCSAPIKYTKQ